MNTIKVTAGVFTVIGLLISYMALSATFVFAHDSDDSFISSRISPRTEMRGISRRSINERAVFHICRVLNTRNLTSINYDCDNPEPDPEPEPEPEPDSPTLEFSSSVSVVAAGATTSLVWDSEFTNSCEAGDGWTGTQSTSGSMTVTLSTTTTYSLTCTGDGGSVFKSVAVLVEQEGPEPTGTHLVISEVLYDLSGDGTQGSEIGGRNEWVEIYNPTDTPVDLMNWEIGDGSSNDVITDSSYLLEPGSFLVITNATTTANFWDFAAVDVIYLQSSISGGLSNTGDSVILFDDSATAVDAVSYGNDISAFSPSVAGVSAGHSIERTDLMVDTDSAADWGDNDTPSPGM